MSNLDNAEFTFDTCVFIELFEKYPKDIFGKMWDLIEKQFKENRIIIIKDVLVELSVIQDEVYNYVKEKNNNIIELSTEIQQNLSKIINKFPNWVKPYSGNNAADPCLVALAIFYNLKVITQEKIKGKKLKIPYVCKLLGVRCGDFLDFLRDNKAQL